jgi:REP element-mobilizing transposase RayT
MRLRGWDYALPGWCFVTIVVKDRGQHFGHVVRDSVEHSPLGLIADACWKEIPQHHFGTEPDEYIVMPNHLHGIVIINKKQETGAGGGICGEIEGRNVLCGDVQLNVPITNKGLANKRLSPVRGSLSVIIRTFKAAVTTWARRNGYGDFTWRGRFHDHIIRNGKELFHIREYIRKNPLNWSFDDKDPGTIH